jgi:hypothetical protein
MNKISVYGIKKNILFAILLIIFMIYYTEYCGIPDKAG